MCVSTRMCGDYCDVKVQCIGDCTDCEKNVCVAPCGHGCHTRSVTNKTTHNVCGSKCGLCLPTPETGCGSDFCCTDSFCNAECKADGDCGSGCVLCAPNLTRCVAPGCGGRCALDQDCWHTGGNCTTCFMGKCTSNCAGKCKSDADCGADCSVCAAGICKPGTCNAPCLSNAGCDLPGTNCTWCSANKCAKGQACGAACTNDHDCDQKGTCKKCPIDPTTGKGKCSNPPMV
eukprot:385975_1